MATSIRIERIAGVWKAGELLNDRISISILVERNEKSAVHSNCVRSKERKQIRMTHRNLAHTQLYCSSGIKLTNFHFNGFENFWHV
jgi:hypothetical protein